VRLCRFDDDRVGVVQGDVIRDVSSILGRLPSAPHPAPWGDPLIARLQRMRAAVESLANRSRMRPIDAVRLLSPVARPSKIIGVPGNYHAHAREAEQDAAVRQYAAASGRSIEEQGLFLKASTAIVGPSEGVSIKFPNRRTDHEVELSVVIGRQGVDIPADRALEHVAGYAIGLDMVVRGPEDRSLRKSLDTYAVLGPWLATPDEVGDPGSLDFELAVNGVVRQRGSTRDMILDVPRLIAWASTFYTLFPGDVIMTGTCEGVGPVVPGDRMSARFERVGEMRVDVRAWAPPESGG
jgi:2-keto-4-pentenoate hydratase/2-oxohepta-3-ene-1,7-dioic acid hydratase in catechol pathway